MKNGRVWISEATRIPANNWESKTLELFIFSILCCALTTSLCVHVTWKLGKESDVFTFQNRLRIGALSTTIDFFRKKKKRRVI